MFEICEYNTKLAFFKFETELTVDEMSIFNDVQKLWNLLFTEQGIYCASDEDLNEMSELCKHAYDHVINCRR